MFVSDFEIGDEIGFVAVGVVVDAVVAEAVDVGRVNVDELMFCVDPLRIAFVTSPVVFGVTLDMGDDS